MPRAARIDIPNILQHVIVRGIEKRDIFSGDDDRHDFVTRFSNLLESTGTDCLAWALLSTHFHLLLRVKDTPLSKFMRRLLTGYAVTFNLRHNRTGHLFQNRYKSIVCDEEEYLLELVRYIHLNPLRAGMVASLEELDSYPFCGHSVLLGKNELKGQSSAEVLSRFSKRIDAARKNYRSFIRDGIAMGRSDELVGVGIFRGSLSQESELKDSRVLGNGEFVEQIIQQTKEGLPAGKIDLNIIVESILAALDVSETELLSSTRELRVANVRAIICHLAVKSGYSGVVVARRLNISGAGVTVAARRGRERIKNHPKLAEIVGL
jgi:REP element-mobilizing transposase RayT